MATTRSSAESLRRRLIYQPNVRSATVVPVDGPAKPSGPPPRLASMSVDSSPQSPRAENVAAASALLETEIAQRNSRKDAQENTARGLIVTAGLVLTLLLGLANGSGVFSSMTSIVARVALLATVVLGAASALCAMGAIWPRKYDRLGEKALNEINTTEYLDQPTHQLFGRVIASRVAIAKKMDEQHERKARWVKRAFPLLAGAFVALLVQAVVLVADPPASKPSVQVRILDGRGTR
jgi:hypothetical protein